METLPSTDTILIPADLVAEIRAAADKEHRTTAEMLRAVIERGLSERRWQAHAGEELQRARDRGVHEAADDLPVTDEYRRTLCERIAQGLRSLREGRVTDGAAFMARMDAELAELERQGQE